ncbi:MAG: phosphotransferase [Actinomycetota bacterium]|nr:phosphotransferase [Actinomycetota bacterium]
MPEHDIAGLSELLGRWLPAQRWYAGKGRPVSGLEVLTAEPLLAGDPALYALVVATTYADDGISERYQILLGLRSELPQRLEHAVIGRLAETTAYDAVHDGELTDLVLAHIAGNETVGTLRFRSDAEVAPEAHVPSRVIGAEQSNTSVVYGEDYILKLFRKLAPGLNPDVELHRALAGVGCTYIAPVVGWVEGELDGGTATLGMLQRYLRSATEGWALATTSVRDLYAEADLHADEVGGDFAGESERLGVATAAVHADLARALPSRVSRPGDAQATSDAMHARLHAALRVVPALEPLTAALQAAYDEVATLADPVPVQRIHGDYHLGQVLRTDAGWILLDFEGEPARPLAERTQLMSPLRDVAGMLRSFDYVARYLLTDHPGEPGLAYRANEWAERNREAFCDGYAQGSGRDPRKESVLLRAFELDKAVYEVVYEARHRPSWVKIPLESIQRLVG